MSAPHWTRLAAKALSEAPVEPSAPSLDARARAIAIERTAVAIRLRARRRRWTRVAIAAGAVAAMFPIAFAVREIVGAARRPAASAATVASPAVMVKASGDGATVTGAPNADAVNAGARIVALPHGHALLSFSNGTRVDVDEGGDVSIVETGASQVIGLARGALVANVAKMAPHERFVVRAPDAEIEVHGTSFRVATVPADASCGDGAVTRVVVYEGVVAVRHDGAEDVLRRGDTWPRGCAREGANAIAIGPRADAPATPPNAAHPTNAAAATPSALAEQNELFARAVAARHRGDLDEAARTFETLLSRYPNAALAESAAAQRMRALAIVDRSRASSAAREYLARWPQGFARGDAEALRGAAP